MFTLTVHDEEVYKRLMEKVEQEGSIDEVLRDLLELDPEDAGSDAEAETPAQKLVRLIDKTELHFIHPFDSSEAEDILRNEISPSRWQES